MTHSGPAPRLFRCILLIFLPFWSVLPAAALELVWPAGAEQVSRHTGPTAGFRIATGPHDGAAVPVLQLEGVLSEEVWRIPGELGDPALVLGMIRDQLTVQGYEIGFVCADRVCGGFDFRYALPIAQEPAMHVDLGRFHYLTAMRASDAGPDHVALTVSHGGQLGYVHLARVSPPDTSPLPLTSSVSWTEAGQAATEGLIARLTATGSAVLSDVAFDTGAAAMATGPLESLVALAAFLAEDPARRIVLVGHTDTVGSLEANTALGQQRAAAVRRHLIEGLGADPGQIDAAGVGYLAPRASNADAAGREANRRVEVVLIAP